MSQLVLLDPNRRTFMSGGYARVNLLKNLMFANFYKQGLRGCVYEIPLIGPSTQDPTGVCQKDNVIIFCICAGLHLHAYYECLSSAAEG